MYEICLLIILSAGGARLPLLRSRALGPFPPAYLTVAVMPLDRESPRTRSPVHPNTSEVNGDRCYAKYGNFIELPISYFVTELPFIFFALVGNIIVVIGLCNALD